MKITKRTLIPQGLRDIVSNFLPSDEIEEFASWAFGEDYRYFLKVMEFSEAWNHLHSNLYKIDMVGTIVRDVYKMTDYFKKKECRWTMRN